MVASEKRKHRPENIQAAAFHEKWVVGYGHSSVAEHAVIHLAVEDVSILTAKLIEDCRLGSYTEKSTRYVVYTKDQLYDPTGFPSREIWHAYRSAQHVLFDAYQEIQAELQAHFLETSDASPYKRRAGFERACMAQACDVARYLLPISTKTNLGITMNARTAAHMSRKLKSHPLHEAQEVGEAIRLQASQVCPTLLKYCEEGSRYRQGTPELIDDWLDEVVWTARVMELEAAKLSEAPRPVVTSVEHWDERSALEKIAAAIVWERSSQPLEAVQAWLSELPDFRLKQMIGAYTAFRRQVLHPDTPQERLRYEQVLRAFEHVDWLTEIECDYGAWRDIQRHRMVTQHLQQITGNLGYEVPEALLGTPWEERFRTAVEQAVSIWCQVDDAEWEGAAYVLPLCVKVRSLFRWNLRELDPGTAAASSRRTPTVLRTPRALRTPRRPPRAVGLRPARDSARA